MSKARKQTSNRDMVEDEESIRLKIDNEYGEIIREINENSNIQIITKNKSDEEILYPKKRRLHIIQQII